MHLFEMQFEMQLDAVMLGCFHLSKKKNLCHTRVAVTISGANANPIWCFPIRVANAVLPDKEC